MGLNKLLVVEDNPQSFLLLRQLLKNIGYLPDQVVHCTTMKDVMDMEENDIDMVLCDLGLPDSEHTDTFIKVQQKFPQIPVIVFTGTNEIEFAVKTIQQGAQDYLVKGEFDQGILDKAIHYAVERKKLINELEISRLDYIRLFEESPSPLFIYDKDTYKFLAVNNAALAQYGYTREEFMTLDMSDIRPEEDMEPLIEKLQQLPDEFYDAGRWRHKRKTGKIFYVHIYAHKVHFENRNARLVMALDVNSKVLTEKALQEKMNEVEHILESITEGFFTVDHHWNITYVNPTFEHITGMQKEAMLGRNLWDISSGNVFTLKFYTEYRRAMTNNVSVHFEEYAPALGKWLNVNAYPTKTGLAIYNRDITDEKLLHERLLHEKQNISAIINNTRDIIWSVDKDLSLISANDAFYERILKLTGRGNRENIARADLEILANDHEAWARYFERALAGETFTVEEERKIDGSTIYEETSFNPIRNDKNDIIGISCMLRDITELKLRMQHIKNQNEQLRQIAWIQSHKVRSGVATIMGLEQLINYDDPTDPHNYDILKKLRAATEKFDEIIKEITERTYNKK